MKPQQILLLYACALVAGFLLTWLGALCLVVAFLATIRTADPHRFDDNGKDNSTSNTAS